MSAILRLICGGLLLFSLLPDAVHGAVTRSQIDQSVLAKSFLLTDGATGEVLISRRADVPFPPASTVKLMTALLVWERTRLQGSFKVHASDTRVEPSHVPLRAGEVVQVRDMTRALLIGSDNDTAMALGRHVAGSHSAFIDLMNRRARELGCRRTVFMTPNGLPATGQVTTSSDMMKIFNAVLQVPELREMCQTKGFTLTTAVGSQWVKNHNKLLTTFPGMGPAKTGWTYASRHTYAASARRGGRELRLVLLNSPNKWNDARLLFEYGFGQVKPAVPSVPSVPASTVAAAPLPLAATSATDAPPVPRASESVHRVRRGDTLYSISQKYGVSVEALKTLNSIENPKALRIGMILRIPD